MGVTKPGFPLCRMREVMLDLFLKEFRVLSSSESDGRRPCVRGVTTLTGHNIWGMEEAF